MPKNNMKKLKSAVVSSVIAVSAMAAPLSTAVMNASAANDNYAKLLQYSLYFYDANMCGKQVGETSALSWRDDCHTSDEVDGGFHDAGDHVNLVFRQAIPLQLSAGATMNLRIPLTLTVREITLKLLQIILLITSRTALLSAVTL